MTATNSALTQTFPMAAGSSSRGMCAPIDLFKDAVKSYVTHGIRRTVVNGLTLQFDIGTSTVFMGPNGCGKSTLNRSMTGVDRLDSGICGLSLSAADHLAVIFQDYRKQLAGCEERNSYVSVLQNVLLPIAGRRDSGYRPADVVSEFADLLKRIGYDIDLHQPVGRLSGGQQQAICLARALAYHPTTLIWDEPTSAIDFGKRGLIYKLITSTRAQRDISCILTTHDIDEALLLGDRIVLFDSSLQILDDVEVPPIGAESHIQFLDSPPAMQVRRRIRRAMLGTMSRE